MAFRPGTDEPEIKLSEEEIKRLAGGTPPPSVDTLMEEAQRGRSVVEGADAPSIDATFDEATLFKPAGERKQPVAQEFTPPPSGMRILQAAAKDAGLAEYGGAFFSALGPLKQGDFAPMAKLARTANVLNDAPLQRAVGRHMPTAVHGENLSPEDQKKLATILSPDFYNLMQEVQQAPLEARVRGFLPGQRQPRKEMAELKRLREQDVTPEFLEEVGAVRELYLNSNLAWPGASEMFLEVHEELGGELRRLLEGYELLAPEDDAGREWWETARELFQTLVPALDHKVSFDTPPRFC
jgi:hypothetical protein